MEDREFTTVELADNSSDIIPRLPVGRDAVVAIHRCGARVVSGEGKREVLVITREQLVQVGAATLEILLWSERVGNTQLRGGSRHELHERSEERRVGKECRSRWSP